MRNSDFKVSVIGQGFVGFPMSVVLSSITKKIRNRKIFIQGIEKNNARGNIIRNKINNGILPFKINDKKCEEILLGDFTSYFFLSVFT